MRKLTLILLIISLPIMILAQGSRLSHFVIDDPGPDRTYDLPASEASEVRIAHPESTEVTRDSRVTPTERSRAEEHIRNVMRERYPAVVVVNATIPARRSSSDMEREARSSVSSMFMQSGHVYLEVELPYEEIDKSKCLRLIPVASRSATLMSSSNVQEALEAADIMNSISATANDDGKFLFDVTNFVGEREYSGRFIIKPNDPNDRFDSDRSEAINIDVVYAR